MFESVRPRLLESIRPLLHNKWVIFVESFVIFFLLWQYGIGLLGLRDVFSTPIIIGLALVELLASGDWVVHFTASIRRIVYSFLAAIVFGVIGGVIIGVSDVWQEILRPYMLIGMAIPGIMVVVFAVMSFGTSDLTMIVSTALLTGPFIADMVYSGVEDIDNELLLMAGSYSIPRARVYRRIVFPAILPEIFASIRFTFSVAWKISTLAEFVIATEGIGFIVSESMSHFAVIQLLTYLALFLIVMLFVEYGIFAQLERWAFAYREDVKEAAAKVQ